MPARRVEHGLMSDEQLWGRLQRLLRQLDPSHPAYIRPDDRRAMWDEIHRIVTELRMRGVQLRLV